MDEGCMKRIAVILILSVVILLIFQQQRNTRLFGELNILNNVISSLQKERDLLKITGDSLTNEIANVKKTTDSLQTDLNKALKTIAILRIENERIKDSLLNVPNDSIYSRMQAIATNVQNKPLVYPFSGPQIRFYYSTYIDNIGNVKLLKSAENALNLCTELSTGLRTEIELHKKNYSVVTEELKLADLQRDLYRTNYETYFNKYNKSKKMSYLWGGTGFILGLLLAR
jgi:type II secretory pathway pseudopilin PulG